MFWFKRNVVDRFLLKPVATAWDAAGVPKATLVRTLQGFTVGAPEFQEAVRAL